MKRLGLLLSLVLASVLSGAPATPQPTFTATPWVLPSPTPEIEQERLYALEREIDRIRARLRDDGRAEAERGRPDWWDLASRARQAERLRNLRRLRRDLERRLEEKEALRQALRPQ